MEFCYVTTMTNNKLSIASFNTIGIVNNCNLKPSTGMFYILKVTKNGMHLCTKVNV